MFENDRIQDLNIPSCWVYLVGHRFDTPRPPNLQIWWAFGWKLSRMKHWPIDVDLQPLFSTFSVTTKKLTNQHLTWNHQESNPQKSNLQNGDKTHNKTMKSNQKQSNSARRGGGRVGGMAFGEKGLMVGLVEGFSGKRAAGARDPTRGVGAVGAPENLTTNTTTNPFCWFRLCLIVFCYFLNFLIVFWFFC